MYVCFCYFSDSQSEHTVCKGSEAFRQTFFFLYTFTYARAIREGGRESRVIMFSAEREGEWGKLASNSQVA